MEWSPASLRRDGTHWHVPPADRVHIYRFVADLCRRHFPASIVSLCKETKQVRTNAGLCSPSCNCLSDISSGKNDRRASARTIKSLPILHP
jgi:hypothetical protein